MLDGGFRQSARIDNHKAVRYGAKSSTELYDLANDIGETNNIANDHPHIVEIMNGLFEHERSDTRGFPYGGVIQKQPARKTYEANQKAKTN